MNIITSIDLKTLYLSYRFKSCESIEKFYFDVYIKKKPNIKKSFLFVTLIEFLGYNSGEYIFKQNEIDEQIKKTLIHIYFYLFKINIKSLLSQEMTSDEQINNTLSIVSSLFANTYLLKYKCHIDDDFDDFFNDIIYDVFDNQNISYLFRFTFLYDLMSSIGTPLKPYDDFIELLQNSKKQIYQTSALENIYYHCIFVFKDRDRFTFEQHLQLFELIKEKFIFEHHYMLKLFMIYYPEKVIAFSQYIRFINNFMVNFNEFMKVNPGYEKKHIRRMLYKMIVSCIRFNKLHMRCACMEKINNMIHVLYQHMYVISENTFLKIISIYFKHYNNVLKLVNMLKSQKDKRYVEVKKCVFDIIDDSFVLSQRDKQKIKAILAIQCNIAS